MFSWKNNKVKKKDRSVFEVTQDNPDRYFNLSKANNNKTKIIFFLMMTNILVILILATLTITRNKDVYIVEKDGNNYTYFGKVNDLTKEVYNPDDNSIIYFINAFVQKNISLPRDLIVYKNNRIESNYFLTTNAKKKLDTYLEDYGYPALIEINQVIDVEISSTLRLTDKTFQVRWIESRFDKNNNLLTKTNHVGLFKYSIGKPKSKEAILYNPLGILITDLSITYES